MRARVLTAAEALAAAGMPPRQRAAYIRWLHVQDMIAVRDVLRGELLAAVIAADDAALLGTAAALRRVEAMEYPRDAIPDGTPLCFACWRYHALRGTMPDRCLTGDGCPDAAPPPPARSR